MKRLLATAASKARAESIQLLNNANEGVDLVVSNWTEGMSFGRKRLRTVRFHVGKKRANDYSFEAASTTMMAYIDGLSNT